MSITIKTEGRRHYILGDTYPIKNQLRSAGCNWDSDRRAWWTGKADVAAKFAGVTTANANTTEDADSIIIIGKAEYKGRTYYVRWYGTCKDGSRKAHLCTIDAKIDFWASMDGSGEIARIVKTYKPMTEGYGKWARERKMTLGHLRRFIEQQKNPDTRVGECVECGSRGPAGELCNDCHEGHFV